MDPQYVSQPASIIPARVVVGVTGHRKLDNQPALDDAVRSAIERIKKKVSTLHSTPLLLCVLSPLAEGADRLVAQEILRIPNSMLEAVLPLEKNDYMQDFETVDSKREFEQLLSQASTIKVLPPRRSRNESYKHVGFYVVDHCDILIALWDGETAAGKGGTGEIVQYARKKNCPLVWINTTNPAQVTWEPDSGLNIRPYQELDEYNLENLDTAKLEGYLKGLYNFFDYQTQYASLPSEELRPVLEYILRHYVRPDLLSLRYQHLYYRTETFVYALALMAIMVAAFQILFLSNQPTILLSEIALMVIVLVVVLIAGKQHWHKKWIDYRFLAERFRSALFMAIVDIDMAALRPPRHLSLAYSSKDWMVIAFASIWIRRPQLQISKSLTLEWLKKFLSEAWLQDQINFHQATEKRHYRRYQRLSMASYIIFGLTIVAAGLHVASVGPHLLGNFFAFLAIILPAIGSSAAAIRTHRDYLRNSKRSGEMVRHLKELKNELVQVQNYDDFLRLVREIVDTMLHENEDWRVVFRFHTLEMPV